MDMKRVEETPKDVEEKLEYLRRTGDFNSVNVNWLVMTVERDTQTIKQQQEQINDAERIITGVLEGSLPDWYEEKYKAEQS